MPDQLQLYTAFSPGMVDYIARHNNNYALIEGAVQELQALMTGQLSGSAAVPLALTTIFDRRGIIGDESYDFTPGVLCGPDYTFPVNGGAFWSGSTFYRKADVSTLSMAGRATGTYYISLDASGTPAITTSPSDSTVWQFQWGADTHTLSAKTRYSGVAILFDGDDYADMLTSAARNKTFTRVADRLEEIEALLSKTVQTPASADNISIDWSKGGHVRVILNRATTTFSFSGAYDSQKCVLELIQDAQGGRTVAFGAEVSAGTDLTLPVPLSPAANKRDFLGFIYSQGNTKYDYVSLSRGF